MVFNPWGEGAGVISGAKKMARKFVSHCDKFSIKSSCQKAKKSRPCSGLLPYKINTKSTFFLPGSVWFAPCPISCNLYSSWSACQVYDSGLRVDNCLAENIVALAATIPGPGHYPRAWPLSRAWPCGEHIQYCKLYRRGSQFSQIKNLEFFQNNFPNFSFWVSNHPSEVGFGSIFIWDKKSSICFLNQQLNSF